MSDTEPTFPSWRTLYQGDLLTIAEEAFPAKDWHAFLGIDKAIWSRWKAGEKPLPAVREGQVVGRLAAYPDLAARAVASYASRVGAPVSVRADRSDPPKRSIRSHRAELAAEIGDHQRVVAEALEDESDGGEDETCEELERERREVLDVHRAAGRLIRRIDHELEVRAESRRQRPLPLRVVAG
jgi:hypothetical protein